MMQSMQNTSRQAMKLSERLVGDSAMMSALRAKIEMIAPIPASVLLLGETGTGKGHVARIIHELSPRSRHPFVHIDCAALSPTLIESELFGHEKGAFTNAMATRIGRFELAGAGTVFLDEIGDMQPHLQAKLLRVLEDRQFERLGSMRTTRMRARVIAATNRVLEADVTQGRFRADLYHRLNVIRLRIPPIREHREDIPALVAFGIEKVLAQPGGQRSALRSLLSDKQRMQQLMSHEWLGNVRELLNTLERYAAFGGCGEIEFDQPVAVEERILRRPPERQEPVHAAGGSLPDLNQRICDLEKDEIGGALRWSGGNVTAAAYRLGMARGTLRYKLEKYGIAPLSGSSGCSDGED